ncbi:MAG: EamA family transporter [Candidatus Binatia bacterium]
MTGVAITLVLLSALLHATWNFFSKGSSDRWAFFLAQGVLNVVIYAPAFMWVWPRAAVSSVGWIWIGASSVIHAAYAFYLLRSYDVGDLSLAYPLSRTAPVLVALWEMVSAPGQLSSRGFLGAMLTGAGAVLLQLPALRARGGRAVFGDRVTRYALLTALFVAAFTVVDKYGVGQVHPFVYLYLIGVGEFAVVGARMGRSALWRARQELRRNSRAVLFTAVLGPFSYLLILWVLTQAPASYVLGLRQASLIFGVLFGRFLLQERETGYRILGAGTIAVGGLLIATAK